MKVLKFPRANGQFQIVLSWQFRRKMKHLKLGLCGKRVRTRFLAELEDRIKQEVNVRWRWFPFIDFLTIKEGPKTFNIFSNDPWPLKCFVEFEFWKYRNGEFEVNSFLGYMTSKYGKSTDEVIDGCTEIMLDVYTKDKDFFKNEKDR